MDIIKKDIKCINKYFLVLRELSLHLDVKDSRQRKIGILIKELLRLRYLYYHIEKCIY